MTQSRQLLTVAGNTTCFPLFDCLATQAEQTSELGAADPEHRRNPVKRRLDTRKLRESFGLHLPPWQMGVARLLDEILVP